jgi:hydrogenase maturation protease
VTAKFNGLPVAKPVLLFACGNLSRGDDALGVLLMEFVEHYIDLTHIDLLSDFQLQIEHILDLESRELVLFVDASVACGNPFEFTELKPLLDVNYTTHSMSPAAVMAVYQSIKNQPPPPGFLLGIKGVSFELGEGLSENASENLEQACRFAGQLLSNPDLAAWRQLANQVIVIPAGIAEIQNTWM